MASNPGFDPNLFAHGIDIETYRSLQRSPERPLFNRAVNGQYPPGSTIKPFVGLAGLERDISHTRGESWCPGWFRLPGGKRRYRDWKKYGHGRIGLQDAIVQSCDVYFYELALALGIDRMHVYLSSFGFGERTGIMLGGESRGLMPSRTWKRSARDQVWYPGETVITGIGQGYMLATPLQLASAHRRHRRREARGCVPRSSIARWTPGAARSRRSSRETITTIESPDLSNWERIVEAMAGVVHAKRGTARRINGEIAYRMAGKTGTAQVFSIGQNEEYDAEKLDKKLHDHGLFIAFAPVEQPRIAVAVVVEHGGDGSTSGGAACTHRDRCLSRRRPSGAGGAGAAWAAYAESGGERRRQFGVRPRGSSGSRLRRAVESRTGFRRTVAPRRAPVGRRVGACGVRTRGALTALADETRIWWCDRQFGSRLDSG